jgi:hypothetical protein
MDKSGFTDHPQPGSGLLVIMSLFLIGFLIAIPLIWLGEMDICLRVFFCTPLVIFTAILVYAFWLLHNTWYRVNQDGLTVKYGLAEVSYLWTEFEDARYRPGVFALKIGWLGVTPCVRLKNALLFKRKNSRVPLYLTPSDSEEFLEKICNLQPDLVK